jgi:hypothetical protein
MASPATRTSAITERRGEARWPNHEYVRGWGVFEPRLAWTLTVARSAVLGLLNPASALLPISTWRPPALRRPRELLAGALGLGTLQLAGRMPSGHHGVLMPQRMYLVNRSQAVLDGLDLGNPTRLRDNPTIGAVPLPARGVLAIGQAMWEIRDPEEYQRIRDDLASSATITEARS